MNSKKLKKYLPFICFFVVTFVIHLLIPHGTLDDKYFADLVNGKSIFDVLTLRYKIWTSRVIIETCFYLFNGRLPHFLWIIIDSILYSFIPILISRLFNKKNRDDFNWIIVLLTLIYPFEHLGSAGYVTTSIAYVWPFIGMLYDFYIIKKQTIDKEKIKIYQYIIAIVGILVSTDMEQFCCFIFGLSISMILFMAYNRRNKFNNKFKLNLKENWLLYLTLLIAIIRLIIIVICPGNKARSISSIIMYYQIYKYFTIVDKSYLGIIPTVGYVLNQRVILSLFSFILMVSCFVTRQKKHIKQLSVIIFMLVILFSLFKDILLDCFPELGHFYSIINNYTFDGKIRIIEFVYIFLIIAFCLCVCFVLYKLFDDNIMYPIVFLGGLGTRFMMGFSPSIYASGERTCFILYFIMIMFVCMLIIKIYDKLKNKSFYNGLIILISLLSYMNTVLFIVNH